MKKFVVDCYGTKIFCMAHDIAEAKRVMNTICIKENILGFEREKVKEIGNCPNFVFKEYEYYICYKRKI
ncbi:MAG: hypothetical protein E7314_02095 [Clostridiales bacterium]|nr:hypothetical protein [Clostridiales bacterium]